MPLIVIMTAFAVLFLLLTLSAEGHTNEECQQLDTKIEEWIEYEYWHGTSWPHLEILEELLVDKRRWCSPIVQARSFYSTNSGSSGAEQWRGLVSEHFKEGKVETALCILFLESKGDPEADNPRSSAAGLFQFLRGTWNSVPVSVSGGSYESGQVYQPEANVRSAAWLQTHYGWSQWSPYNNGYCRGL